MPGFLSSVTNMFLPPYFVHNLQHIHYIPEPWRNRHCWRTRKQPTWILDPPLTWRLIFGTCWRLGCNSRRSLGSWLIAYMLPPMSCWKPASSTKPGLLLSPIVSWCPTPAVKTHTHQWSPLAFHTTFERTTLQEKWALAVPSLQEEWDLAVPALSRESQWAYHTLPVKEACYYKKKT